MDLRAAAAMHQRAVLESAKRSNKSFQCCLLSMHRSSKPRTLVQAHSKLQPKKTLAQRISHWPFKHRLQQQPQLMYDVIVAVNGPLTFIQTTSTGSSSQLPRIMWPKSSSSHTIPAPSVRCHSPSSKAGVPSTHSVVPQ